MQIGMKRFSEATIGYDQDKEVAHRWVELFTTDYFIVSAVSFSFGFLNLQCIYILHILVNKLKRKQRGCLQIAMEVSCKTKTHQVITG